MGLTTTEKIVSWGAKKVFDKAVGGIAPVISSYYKLHFVLLSRVLKEWNRDKKLQDAIEKIRKNLTQVRAEGRKFLRAIPGKPVPPALDGDLADDPAHRDKFDKDMKAFIKGVNHVRHALMDHIRETEALIKKTKDDLSKVEKKLESGGSSLRQISNLSRLQDVQWVRIKAMSELQSHVSDAKSLLKAYNNI